MKTYHGKRRDSDDACLVTVQDPSRVPPVHMVLEHVVVHSPTGFSWGYGGSGPSDLALSILTDFLHENPKDVLAYYKHGALGDPCDTCDGDGWLPLIPPPAVGDMDRMCSDCKGLGSIPVPVSKAWRWHHEFLRQYVAQLDRWSWEISAAEIHVFIERMLVADALETTSAEQGEDPR